MRNVRGVPVVLLAMLLAACTSTPTPSRQPGTIEIVTTTSVFADFARNVGRDLVNVTSLVPPGADVHTYSPTPQDVQTLSRAQLIVMNGLGLDDWLEDTIRSANSQAQVVKLGVDVVAGLPPSQRIEGEQPSTDNPHLWMSVPLANEYAALISNALIQLDHEHFTQYEEYWFSYDSLLDQLDAWVRQQVATIPPEDRKLVTFHDAFPYFAREYGITIVGVAVQAPGQDPSAAEIAQLIEAIKASGVKAIFSENQFPTKLVDTLAEETGARVVANLYDDSIGDPPVTSYDAVIRWDVTQLVDALR